MNLFLKVLNTLPHDGNITLKDRADPDKVGLYQLFKKPGVRGARYKGKDTVFFWRLTSRALSGQDAEG